MEDLKKEISLIMNADKNAMDRAKKWLDSE